MIRLPWWKKILSRFREVHIETVTGLGDEPLSVYLYKGRLQLCVRDAIYSYDDYYINFYRAFAGMDLKALPDRNVLVLGLGLGSVPYMLERHFGRDFDYTAIELDEAVIYLASRYTLPRLSSPLEIYQADGRQWLEYSSGQFGLICMDIFTGDQVPEHMTDQGFIELLRDHLSPGGCLLFNRLYRYKQDRDIAHRFVEEVFAPVFPEYTTLEIEGNLILFSDRRFISSGQPNK